jgi:hypothetical protein
MLLIGNDCISDDEARTQMAIWSISAAPLIMGNDLRNVTDSAKAILQNTEAIAVDQDMLGHMGYRITPSNATEIWARNITGGAVAVGLYNKLGNASSPASCPTWNITLDGYMEACGGGGGDIDCFSGEDLETVLAQCCANPVCAGLSYSASSQSGCMKTNSNCGMVNDTNYMGFEKPNFTPPSGAPTDITIFFSQVGLSGKVMVRDIWAQQNLGVYTTSYTASQVPLHGTAFLKLTQQ